VTNPIIAKNPTLDEIRRLLRREMPRLKEKYIDAYQETR
jgi:hypothetical protein